MHPPVVVGAGTCGLAVGLALREEGYEPDIVDSAAEPDDETAWLLLGTNARHVLHDLGVGDEVLEAGLAMERFRLLDADGRTLLALSFGDLEESHYRYAPVSVDRVALRDALHDALPDDAVTYDRTCTGTAHQSGEEQVQFADGERRLSSLVVGADGVRSTVRRSLFPDARLRSTGWRRYRGVARTTFEEHLRPEVWQVWGPEVRVAFGAIDGDRVGWSAAVADGFGRTDRPAARLSELCEGYPEPVRTLFARTDPATVVEAPVVDLAPLERWHAGGITLAGAAAHAAIPWLGLERSLGLADAAALVGGLRGADDVPTALERYETERKPDADWFVRRARQLHRISIADGSLRRARNGVLRTLPPRATHPIRRRLAASH